jgi:hypothetical protein
LKPMLQFVQYRRDEVGTVRSVCVAMAERNESGKQTMKRLTEFAVSLSLGGLVLFALLTCGRQCSLSARRILAC